jgi:hypothetical protein
MEIDREGDELVLGGVRDSEGDRGENERERKTVKLRKRERN